MDLTQIIAYLEEVFASLGLPLIFLASFVEISPLGWLLPGGTILAIAGFFAYGSEDLLAEIILAGWMGGWSTFVFAYILGIKYGMKLVETFDQEKNIKRAEKLLKKQGPAIMTTSMLASITRFWIAFVAGTNRFKFSTFMFYSGIASLTWSSLMVVVGYLAGRERHLLEESIRNTSIISWVMLGIVGLIIYRFIKKELKEEAKSVK